MHIFSHICTYIHPKITVACPFILVIFLVLVYCATLVLFQVHGAFWCFWSAFGPWIGAADDQRIPLLLRARVISCDCKNREHLRAASHSLAGRKGYARRKLDLRTANCFGHNFLIRCLIDTIQSALERGHRDLQISCYVFLQIRKLS